MPVFPREIAHNLHPLRDPFAATLVKREKLSQRRSPFHCWHLTFDISGARFYRNWLPGQALGVLPPGTDPSTGKRQKLRLYSVASPSAGEDANDAHVALTVKRLVEERPDTHRLFVGTCSNWLCDQAVGATIPLTGPVGKHYVLPEAAEKYNYVFIATGTGVAPVRAMLLELYRGGVRGTVAFLFGVPYSTDIYYDALFRQYVRDRGLIYELAVSREMKNDSGAPLYVHHRLEQCADRFGPLLCDPQTLVYICGVKGMEQSLYRQFARLAPGLIVAPAELDQDRVDDPLWKRLRPNKERCRVEVY